MIRIYVPCGAICIWAHVVTISLAITQHVVRGLRVQLSLFHNNEQVLEEAALDILVFADQLSEPQAYTYNFARFAAVQVRLR